MSFSVDELVALLDHPQAKVHRQMSGARRCAADLGQLPPTGAGTHQSVLAKQH